MFSNDYLESYLATTMMLETNCNYRSFEMQEKWAEYYPSSTSISKTLSIGGA